MLHVVKLDRVRLPFKDYSSLLVQLFVLSIFFKNMEIGFIGLFNLFVTISKRIANRLPVLVLRVIYEAVATPPLSWR